MVEKTILLGYEQDAMWDYYLDSNGWSKTEILSFLNFIRMEIESGEYKKKLKNL